MNIRCVSCGKFYPEEEYVCPECSCVPDLFLCPDCGAICSAQDSRCAYCGAPLEGKLACALEEDADKEYRILLRELKAEDTTPDDLRAIRRSLSLLSRYIDTDSALLRVNRILMDKEMATLRESLTEKADAMKEDERSVPASELPELIRQLEAAEEAPELVERYSERAEQARAKMRRKGLLAGCAVCGIVILIAGTICAKSFVIPASHYASAERAFAAGDYPKAEREYTASDGWKDAIEKKAQAALGVHYSAGLAAIEAGDYALAEDELKASNGFLDSEEQIMAARYAAALSEENSGRLNEAATQFAALGTYADSSAQVLSCAQALFDQRAYSEAKCAFSLLDTEEARNGTYFAAGMAAYESGDDEAAIEALKQVSGSSTAEETLHLAQYRRAEACYESGDFASATELYRVLPGYQDADAKLTLSLFYQAESAYSEGRLNTAAECYRALPSGYEKDGISAASRLKAIEGKENYLGLCGLWTTNGSPSYSVKKVNITNGVWNQRAGNADDLQADIRCRILDNGRIHLEGTAQYMRFTEYDKEKSEVKLCTVEISQDLITLPYSFMADDNVKITVTRDHLELYYNEEVKSYAEWYYYDKFETECSYEKKLETY